MGRYLSANFVTYLGEKRLRCYTKISTLRRTCLKSVRAKQKHLNSGSSGQFADIGRKVTHETTLCSQAVRLYSTSSRNVFKSEPPIGIHQEEKPSSLQLSVLGLRLGESFQRLSKHINFYFKSKDLSVASSLGNSGLVYTFHEPQRRQQRHSHSPRAGKDRIPLEGKRSSLRPVAALHSTAERHEDQTPSRLATAERHEDQTPSRLATGLQLFHISSLATRFGESYNYVANHINSVFSTSPARDLHAKTAVDGSRFSTVRHGRRRKTLKVTTDVSQPSVNDVVSISAHKDNAKNTEVSSSCAHKDDAKTNEVPGSWEEGYLHFAHHINRYFGAKVTDSVSVSTTQQNSRYDTEPKQNSRSYTEPKQTSPSAQPTSPGLFHLSNITTSFGANHAHMASHINHYFKGQPGFEDDLDGDYVNQTVLTVSSGQQEKPSSFMHYLLHSTAAIPDLIGSYLGVGSKNQGAQAPTGDVPTATRSARSERLVLGQDQAEEMTKVLLANLRSATASASVIACAEELNRHLIAHPACKAMVWQEKLPLQLLKYRRNYTGDVKLQRALRETMALIGYLDPVRGRGVRMLSIDGGGTRGVVPLEVLKVIEAQTGRRIHELFDYICGVSTGAVLAFMIGLGRFSLDDCEEMYRRFGSDVFKQNPLVGTVKMGWSHSYYSTETWETLLKEKMGERVLIKTARSEICPKVSAVSAVVNWGTSPKAFIFRNYNHAPGRLSRYPGGSAYKLWEAVRASSAAPGYFREFPLYSDIHQDGGLIQNNPCALAVHECRLLWPTQPFQCVLSLGTGRYDNTQRGPATSTSLRAKLSHLIYSATDTEGVHTLLDDLLEENVYFRFNPMLSAEVSLDESRVEVLDQLKSDTLLYLERNKLKLDLLCMVLRVERSTLSKSKDWLSERAWELRHRWV
ncbi:calcium-independent phospholipase A2-gamma-like isoform X2 [Alosa sapidissima]|uniref:calcium-independent phospholipase A2-gamma-like isoform X2 n=1 Tax=Alosa sapidissima TaxID=34773 RepID=UPI001C087578|nr:calcium-independent phospholipase A2-gamma-like isoform X2 [Alosa sapidissima]